MNPILDSLLFLPPPDILHIHCWNNIVNILLHPFFLIKICTSHKLTFFQHNILKEIVKIISFYCFAEAYVTWPLQSDEKEVADIDW